MGLPISRFQMLSRLCSEDLTVRAALAPYKLKCIVLHDPDDKRFRTRMKKSFLDLHARTGTDLLFITFIDPPKGWEDTLGHSNKIIDPQRLTANSGFDDWLMARHLLPAVAPDSNLPCLLITDDLLSRDFLLLESSVEQVVEQLTELGRYCSQAECRFPVTDRRFLEFASSLGPCRLSGLSDVSLAAALTDVLAIQEIGIGDMTARRWAEHRLQELKSGGEGALTAAFRYEAAVQREKKRANASVLLRPAAERVRARAQAPCWPQIGPIDAPPTLYRSFFIQTKGLRNYQLCDVRSRGNILDYNELLEVFIPKRTRDEEKVVFSDSRHSTQRSFKPLAQPLAEFFEREVNLTIVQLMRKHFKIEMPEYYMKYKKDFWAIVKTPKNDVPLNACEYPDRLKSVMLGNALYAYKELCRPWGTYKMPEVIGGRFLDDWSRMVDLRNTVSHAAIHKEDFFGFKEFREFHAVFTSLLEDSVWKMEAVGEALRKGEELPKFD